MGSVKDLIVLREPEGGRSGTGRFVFSDRYSVFDWGEMPDHIEKKGQALCMVGAHFFERLEEMGIRTHYVGVVEKDRLLRLSELEEPVNSMEIKLLRVIEPEIKGDAYDYSVYQKERSNLLIPLEVIYRNSLPEGSSVFRRLKDRSLKPEDIGLEKMPLPGQKLGEPILDVSTKLEATDRYLTWEEARASAGLTDDEVAEMKRTALCVDELITKEVERLGLVHEDGKVEFGFEGDRNLLLIDVLGTPDECRFTFRGIPVSKEVARIFYRGTRWFKEVEEAKGRDRTGWRQLVTSRPPELPGRLCQLTSLLYQAFCNEITGRSWFETPSLEQILLETKGVLGL